VAEPEHRGGDVRQHVLAITHNDRLLRPRRGKDLRDHAIEADRPAVQRVLHPLGGAAPAAREGGGEIRVALAPAVQRGKIDPEEIGDIVILETEAGELAGLGGAGGAIAGRDGVCGLRIGGLGIGGVGAGGARNFPVFGAVTGNFSFFPRLFGRLYVIFRCDLSVLPVISLFRRNREITGAEQGIGPAGAGNGSRAVTGGDGRDRLGRDAAQGEAQCRAEQRQRGREGGPERERGKHSHGGTVAGARAGLNQGYGAPAQETAPFRVASHPALPARARRTRARKPRRDRAV